MKTFLVLALLAMTATMATAVVQFDPSGQYQSQQPFPQPQQQCAQTHPFSQEQQQPFLQQQPGQFDLSGQFQSQQPFPHPQLPFMQQQPYGQFDPIGQYQSQQPFWKLQHMFSKKQQPFLQQQQPGQFDPSGLYQSQLSFPQIQQPFAHPWQFPHEQQQFPEQQQPFLQQQQQQFFQPFLVQQLNPCRQFLMQQCSPVVMLPFLRSKIFQQSNCQVMRQQCCRQLAQIPEQLRCHAIHNVVHAMILQQQQQLIQPQQQIGQGFFQPQLQQTSQGFIQPQQLAQLEAIRMSALQTCRASAVCRSRSIALVFS